MFKSSSVRLFIVVTPVLTLTYLRDLWQLVY